MTNVPLPANPRPAPPPPPRRASSWLLGVLVLLFGCSMLLNLVLFLAIAGKYQTVNDGLTEKHPPLRKKDYPALFSGRDKVAVLRLEGTIMDGESLRKQIDRLAQDTTIKAAVLRVNSPGGTVFASDLLFHRLKMTLEERKIPLTVSMGAICASGGYYVSMACGAQKDSKGVIFAEPATWCGSIGVIIPHYDLSGLAESLKIKDDSIKSHPLKGLGNPLVEMSPEERKVLTELVKESFTTFKERVKFGRKQMSDAKLDQVATGQIFTTKQALEHGLVDKEGFLEAAIDHVMTLAGLDKQKTQVVEYRLPPSLFEVLSGADARALTPQSSPLERLLEGSVPQAYYLHTALPAWISTRATAR